MDDLNKSSGTGVAEGSAKDGPTLSERLNMRASPIRLAAAFAAVASLWTAAPSAAQSPAGPYPSRRIEVIVPYAAGGAVNSMARLFADEATRISGQQWVVLNREGAGGTIGFAALVNSKPDGYTVAFSPASPITNAPFVTAKMPFSSDQVKPVCMVFENIFAIAVRDSSSYKTLGELMDAARAKPGHISYGHSGPGSVGQLSVAVVERDSNVKFNSITYKSDAQSMTDALGGTLDFAVPSLASLAGKNLRILAILSETAHPSLPRIPTIKQLGYTAISPGLNGLFVPAATPPAVVDALSRICQTATNSEGFARGASILLQVPSYLPSDRFKSRIDAAYKTNASLVPNLHLEKN